VQKLYDYKTELVISNNIIDFIYCDYKSKVVCKKASKDCK
jgi:hypothetical protein